MFFRPRGLTSRPSDVRRGRQKIVASQTEYTPRKPWTQLESAANAGSSDHPLVASQKLGFVIELPPVERTGHARFEQRDPPGGCSVPQSIITPCHNGKAGKRGAGTIDPAGSFTRTPERASNPLLLRIGR